MQSPRLTLRSGFGRSHKRRPEPRTSRLDDHDPTREGGEKIFLTDESFHGLTDHVCRRIVREPQYDDADVILRRILADVGEVQVSGE